MENISEAAIAREQGFLTAVEYEQMYKVADKLARMLSGLRSSLLHPKLNP